MSTNPNEINVEEQDVILDPFGTGRVNPRVREQARTNDRRPRRRERLGGLLDRGRAAVATQAAVPLAVASRFREPVAEAVERGQEAVARAREFDAEARERLDREVEERTGVDLPEVRAELRELDPFDRMEGRRRELEVVGPVGEPVREQVQRLEERFEETTGLGAGAVATGTRVGTRFVPGAAAGVVTVEALERLQDSPGFRGELDVPEDRVERDERSEIPVPESRVERDELSEIPVSEDQARRTRDQSQSEITVDETQRQGTFQEEIGVPDQQTQEDPRVVQTEQIVIGRQIEDEEETQRVITEQDLQRTIIDPEPPGERVSPLEQEPTRRVREETELGPMVREEEATTVRDPVQEQFEVIESQRQDVLSEEFGPRDPGDDPEIGTEPERIVEDTSIVGGVSSEARELQELREREEQAQQEITMVSPEFDASVASDPAVGTAQDAPPLVDTVVGTFADEDALSRELERERELLDSLEVSFSDLPEVMEDVGDRVVEDTVPERITQEELLDEPVTPEVGTPTVNPPEYVPEYPPEYPPENPPAQPPVEPPGRPPVRTPVPKLDDLLEEDLEEEEQGLFDFQLVTDLPLPGEVDAPPASPTGDLPPLPELPDLPDPPEP